MQKKKERIKNASFLEKIAHVIKIINFGGYYSRKALIEDAMAITQKNVSDKFKQEIMRKKSNQFKQI